MEPQEQDDDLIARLQAGDLGALESCYRLHGARIHGLCRRMLGRDHAEDAVQEVFVKVIERAAGFRGGSRLSTWLHQVAVNHCLKRLERERLRRTLEIPASAACRDGEERLRAVDDREQIERALSGLAPEQRAVIVLRELQGLDYAEIAAVLEIPVGTVMSRLFRARTRLLEQERMRTEGPRALGALPT
ncbi:MAG: RNA polymerase sigma factor [Planctomycetes bacterium]|nr:RNA polymerase sigma factor [Planctomycetota bacterium]